jgi:hypothetical protein
MSGTHIEKKDLKSLMQKKQTATAKTFAEADRRKGGRPPLSDDEKVSKIRLTIYLTPDEEEKIKNAAAALGTRPQAFVKMASFAFMNKAD